MMEISVAIFVWPLALVAAKIHNRQTISGRKFSEGLPRIKEAVMGRWNQRVGCWLAPSGVGVIVDQCSGARYLAA
jgi:hypothetical protein